LTAIYELRNIIQRYSNRTVLDIPDLEIEKGAIVGITGPNGSGKSTLLRILAFLERPAAGDIFFNGEHVRDIDDRLRRKATLLLQESRLLKRTVFDNVAYGLNARGIRKDLTAKVHEALRMVGLDPGEFAVRSWFQLSGGESQRVALASRLVLEPEVLILDEPTASIDALSGMIITRAILKAREMLGTTIVIVSHDVDWAYGASDEVLSMFSGRIRSKAIENILHGPWQKNHDGTVCMHLDDGQAITAIAPPDGDLFTALLDPEDIILSMDNPGSTSARNTVKGTVVRMNLENGERSVLVTVSVGGFKMTSRVTTGSLSRLGLVPGKQVLMVFKATAFRWV